MTLVRPAFHDGIALTAALFGAEQTSRIDRILRHGTRGHLSGIASGLEISVSAGQIRIAPGVALMPNGHVVCLPETQVLDGPPDDGRYAVLLRDQMMPGRRGIAISAAISLEAEVAPEAVCLGAVIGGDDGLSRDLADRQTIGSVADRVTSPDRDVTLALGRNEDRAHPELAVSFAGEEPPFTLSRGRGARLAGQFTIHVGVGNPTALRAPTIQFPTAGEAPEDASPWSLRRVPTVTDEETFDELRLELHHPGKNGDPARSRLVIGALEDAPPDAPALTGLAINAEGEATLFQDGEPASQGLNVIPPGRVALSPVSPDPTDPAFAVALTEAMLQGLTWALLIATLNSGITGAAMDGTDPVAGVTVTLGERTAITDSTGRFFLASAGWPGETVLLSFSDEDDLGTLPAVVRAGLQFFDLEISGNNGDII